MRQLFVSIALISRIEDDRSRWLVRWRSSDGCYDLVRGLRLEKESFRETIDREVGWQLGLSRERDYLVSNMAQLNLEFVDILPGEPGAQHVAASFYPVHLYGREARSRVEQDGSNRWVTADELLRGRVQDGTPVSPVTHHLLHRGDVIAPWQ